MAKGDMRDKLDLDSTIKRLEDKEKTLRLFNFDKGCFESDVEHNQIVEWLKELKELREKPAPCSVITMQKTTSNEAFLRYDYDADGNMVSINITNGDEFKSETWHVGCDFVYRGNVNVKFWEKQTVKEAIDEYYKSMDKTPIYGDIVIVDFDNAYVYLGDWVKMKVDSSSTNTDPPLMEHYQFTAEIWPTANQTDEEAITAYYESINKSPIYGDVVSIKNSKKCYVYTGYKWDKWNMK